METKKRVRGIWFAVTLASGLLGTASSARAQSTTERYIPLGQSPGVSGKSAVMGTISAVDSDRRLITLKLEKETVTALITERTEIWLDRTSIKHPNAIGKFDDCRIGRVAEVKYEDPQRRLAEWIKLQIVER